MTGLEQTTHGEATTLPLGRRSPSGRLRWYLVRCPEGREDATCAKVRQIVPNDLLEDAFVPKVERVKRLQGGRRTLTRNLFEGYFVVSTTDAPALSRTLDKLTFPVQMAGNVGRGYAPVVEEAQQFLAKCMDSTHTIRTSEAEIARGRLHVLRGPLVGQESRIRSFEAGRHDVSVSVCEDTLSGASFSVTLPIDIVPAAAATEESVSQVATMRRHVGTSLPMGRRTPKGRLRWYLVECPEGTEAEMCDAVRSAVPADVLQDAYVPRVEKIKKVNGEWVKHVRSLVSNCFAVATTDSAALKVELEKTSLPLRLVGRGQDFQPLDDDAWGFVESFMDDSRTIRESQGEILEDQLHVWSGPLAGRESVVRRYNRRKSLAFVNLGFDQSGEHTLLMPLSILARR